MRPLFAVFAREWSAFFATPLGAVFLIAFSLANGLCVFYLGQFLERGEATLDVFFAFHPYLYLAFVPAVAMRLFAEERQSGAIEILFALPLPLWSAVLGKYLAALAFSALALGLTFPLWASVNYLGAPDNGAILAGYGASLLLAAAFLAVCTALSAGCAAPLTAFISGLSACFLLFLAGWPTALDFLSPLVSTEIISALAGFSLLAHFESITQGLLDLRSLVFFASHIAFWLAVAMIILDQTRA